MWHSFWHKLLLRFTAHKKARVIKINGEPYMLRYYVGELFGLRFYLHQFVRNDEEEWLHNHPWERCFSIIIAGGYREQVLRWLCPHYGLHSHRALKERWVRWFNVIGPMTFHRIQSVTPHTWTLFCHTKRVKSWGFIKQGRIAFMKESGEPLYDDGSMIMRSDVQDVVSAPIVFYNPIEDAIDTPFDPEVENWHLSAKRPNGEQLRFILFNEHGTTHELEADS